MKRIYLAGPEVFLPDARAVGAHKKRLCAAAGFEGVFPLDAALELDRLSMAEQAERIFDACERLMRSCDLCIANATPFRGVSIDSGTAYEIGFMRALGKPVFVYSNAAGTYTERATAYRSGARLPFDGDRADVEIENFGHIENLMIAVASVRSGAVPMAAAAGTTPTIGAMPAFEACLSKVAANFA